MKKTLFFSFFFSLILTGCIENKPLEVTNLRCEMRENPRGIDRPSPRFSWEIQSTKRNIKQESYRIIVASSLLNLTNDTGDIWDSGTVLSAQSTAVAYEGKDLESRSEYFWKVEIKTNAGDVNWSQPVFWTMGLLNASDWSAQWIGIDSLFAGEELETKYTRLAARYLRKEFTVDKKIKRATLYISGLGLYEAYINQQRIGTQVLAPTPTDYVKTVKYNTFDVTDRLIGGNNALGVVLGNGRFFTLRHGVEHYGFPKLIAQLEIEYDGGEKAVVASDGSWKLSVAGPIRANNEYDGEEYDARMEMPGWNAPGFNDDTWLSAEPVAAPEGKLEAQLNPNIQIMETILPVALTENRPGVYILDMGQNMVGWLNMKVKGKPGDTVQLRFAETLKDDGSLYMDNLREALVTDKYILKGSETEQWEPSFTYHGFRFVEITGYPGAPALADFGGRVVYDEMAQTGHFETSNALINQLYKNAYWGIRGNYRGMPTDCPQRDERMGWLGDRAVGSQGESYIFDNYSLYSKWLDDIEQCQLENGSISDVAPHYWRVYSDNMTWPGAYIIIANMLYEQYGNSEPIFKHYDSMKKWLNYMKEKYMVDNILTKDTYGDWCMPPETPELIHSQDPGRKTEGAVLSTTFYYRMMVLMERFARITGKPEEAQSFADEANLIKTAFNEKYLDKKEGRYSNNTVTANLLPLCFGMVPEEYRELVFKNIVDKTEGEFNSHVSTGLVGIQWLMRGLSDYDRADLAYTIVTNKDYPSWGYMVEKGATTIWELWNGDTAEPSMNSGNHVMLLGDLIVWFYEYLAGIKNAPGSFGFEQIEMKPFIIGGLDYVTADFHSVKGLVKSAWKKQNGIFNWQITLPANTGAILYIPAASKEAIQVDKRNITQFEEIKFLRTEGEYQVFECGSGNYTIVVK